MSDDQTQDVTAPVAAPEIAPTPTPVNSSQSAGSGPADVPLEAPESPINEEGSVAVKDDNSGSNSPKGEGSETAQNAENPVLDTPEPAAVVQQTSAGNSAVSVPAQPASVQTVSVSAPTPLTPPTFRPQSSAQPSQPGFIAALLAKANAKIQSHKQKKLNEIILFAQKKKIFANEDVQKLLHVSSATATRYLVTLVQQGHLTRVGSPRDAKYQFVR